MWFAARVGCVVVGSRSRYVVHGHVFAAGAHEHRALRVTSSACSRQSAGRQCARLKRSFVAERASSASARPETSVGVGRCSAKDARRTLPAASRPLNAILVIHCNERVCKSILQFFRRIGARQCKPRVCQRDIDRGGGLLVSTSIGGFAHLARLEVMVFR